ncbi:MAG: hypothetical protein KDA51_15600, partial [Planctomycetales bacterium]|nr:hypothetical protein [Planctomycetales bacterium]
PAGYDGPDLYLYMYVDQVAAGGDILDPVSATVVETTIVPGLRNLSVNTNPFQDGAKALDSELVETVSKYFPLDLELPNEEPGEITLNLPRQASSYALVAPASWGERRSPGEIHASIQELVRATWQVRMAADAYESQADDFQNLLKRFELKSGIATENLLISRTTLRDQRQWRDVATGAFAASTALLHIAEVSEASVRSSIAALPTSVGLSFDPSSAARGLLEGILGLSIKAVARGAALPLEVTQYRAELASDLAVAELDRALLTQESKSELVDILSEINDLVNSESDALLAVVDAMEEMRAASDRVRIVLEQGQALIEERKVFNQRVAATTTKMRYED